MVSSSGHTPGGMQGRGLRTWLLVGTATAVLVTTLVSTSSIGGPVAQAAPGDGEWQVQLAKVAPDPVEAGVPTPFVLSVQCSALEAPTCVDGVVTIPLPEGISSVIDVDPHPFVLSSSTAGGALSLTLNPNFPAGGSLQIGLRFRAPNITTPNGFSPTFTTTVDGTNTAPASDSATATFTATPSMSVTKRLPNNAPNGVLYPLDLPLRYTMSVCDTRMGPGVLGMEETTVVDTLPEGATFEEASNGGVYDASTGTVTWQLGAQTELCYPTLWVEVSYATGDVDPDTTVTNTVTATGRPLGTDDEVTSSAEVHHGFGDPVAQGDFCKTSSSFIAVASSPCGTNADVVTHLGPWLGDTRDLTQSLLGGRTESSYQVQIDNSSAVAGTVDFVDPVPCRTNSDGATPATYTSNAPGDLCTDPAWIVTGIRNTGVFPESGFALAILNGNYPTYVTTAGVVRDFIASPITGTADAPQWLFTPQPGDVVAEIRWTDVPAPVNTGVRASRARVFGYLAEGLQVGDRATNVASSTLTVGASVLESTAAASIVGSDDTVARVIKTAVSTTGFNLSATVADPSPNAVWSSGLVIADLLPAGLPAVELSSSSLPASDYVVEQIPDHQGSGRTLLRVTVAPGAPALAQPAPVVSLGFRVPGGAPFPWVGSRSNTARLFVPGRTIDRCATGTNELNGAVTPGSGDSDDWDGDGVTDGDNFCSSTVNLTRPSGGAAIQVTKEVRGNLDTTYASYPKVALSDPSLPGDAGYRVTIRNSGGSNLRDAVLYDVLPTVGDTGVSAGQVGRARGSSFTPLMEGPVVVSSDASVTWEIAYSTAAQPCRPEVGDGSADWPESCTDDWSVVPPADLGDVTALRFRQTGGLLTPDAAATSTSTFTWPMSTPPDAAPGDVAWNTTASVAVNDANGLALLASEPPKVGLSVPLTDVELTKSADRAAAAIGEEITYTITASHGTTVVTNPDGSVSYLAGGAETAAVAPATGVVVTDVLPAGLTLVPDSIVAQQGTFDPGTGEWTVGTIEVGGSVTLTYRATLTAVGAQTNRAEVTASEVADVDSTPGNCATIPEDDCDSVTIDNLTAGLSLDKLVESSAGSGDYLDADDGTDEYGLSSSGAPVRYRFVVTNTGQSGLSEVTIVDPLIPFFCDDDFDIGAIAAGGSVTVDCTLPIGFSLGTTVNTATVTARTPGGQTLDASDTAQVLVPTPSITVEKTTNGLPAETPTAAVRLDVGDAVTWTYVVRNSGVDDLVDLTLVDDREAAVTLDAERCIRSSGDWGEPLPPGATITCTHTGAAVAGDYVNVATVTGRGVVTPLTVADVDPSHYTTLATTTPPPSTPPPSSPPPTPSTTTPPPPDQPGPAAAGGSDARAGGRAGASASPASGSLPVTGVELRRLLALGVLLTGLGVVVIRRRRATAELT